MNRWTARWGRMDWADRLLALPALALILVGFVLVQVPDLVRPAASIISAGSVLMIIWSVHAWLLMRRYARAAERMLAASGWRAEEGCSTLPSRPTPDDGDPEILR